MEEFDAMFTGVVLTFANRGEAFRAWRYEAERADGPCASPSERLRDVAVFFIFLASLALVVPGVW